MSEAHPDTVSRLRKSLTSLRMLAGIVPDEDPQEVILAAGELRSNFPGVDDLTLAAFAGYVACVEAEGARDLPSVLAIPIIGGAAAYAKIAVCLAGDLEPEGEPE